MTSRRVLSGRAAALLPVACLLAAGCGTVRPPVPGCSAGQRLAAVAQSVPSASYVPCLAALPEGWQVTRFDVESGRTRLSLAPDRGGGRAVHIELTERCDIAGAAPEESARSDGARTYSRLRSIAPRYAGTLFDVFPGGCVSYRFDFDRGPHIVLMEELRGAVGLFPRRQLRFDLHREFGVELDP